MVNIFHRWASLGLYVRGEINPYEDPEALLIKSLGCIEKEERLLGMIVSWVASYGYLLLTKKLKFASRRERRLFSAIVEESGTSEKKLLSLVHKSPATSQEFLYPNDYEILKQRARECPNSRFLRHGFILKDFELLRPAKIVMPLSAVFKRSAILRNRALFGVSVRTDFLTLLPALGKISVRQIAQRLNVTPQAVERIVHEYVRSGLIDWNRKGRSSHICWCGPVLSEVA